MKWSNLFSVALRALWRNKSRSILTMLGVIIGVGAVIMLVAIGNGLQAFIVNQFEAFGSNNIFIATGDLLGEEGGGGGFSDQSVSSLTQSVLEYDDLRAIRRLPSIRDTSGFSFGTARVAYRNTSKQLTIAGASDTYASITNTKAIRGRFFNRSESEGGEKVAFWDLRWPMIYLAILTRWASGLPLMPKILG
jgi:ABC-type antimicrobial peptide transport system permease subunit